MAEDCAPPKDNEGILFVHKGQIYDVVESKSDWWWARLVRDLTASAELCQQGWVPGSFLEKYGGSLTTDEQSKINTSELTYKADMAVCETMGRPSHATLAVSGTSAHGWVRN